MITSLRIEHFKESQHKTYTRQLSIIQNVEVHILFFEGNVHSFI